MNLLGQLKIKCDYSRNGCNEVIKLEDLTNHVKSCIFEEQKCDKCLCVIEKDHDCIEALLKLNGEIVAENNKLKAENELMKNSKEKYFNELTGLKLERENFLKSIQEITNNNAAKSTDTFESKMTHEDILNEARKNLSNFQIILNEITKESSDKVVKIVKKNLIETNNLHYLCKNIENQMNDEFGAHWICVSIFDNYSSLAYTYLPKSVIKLKFGKLIISIFKSAITSFDILKKRFCSGNLKREITISDSIMKPKMVTHVQHLTFLAIEKSDNLFQMATFIKNGMKDKFSGNWNCVIYKCGTYFVTYEQYILYSLDDYSITVFTG